MRWLILLVLLSVCISVPLAAQTASAVDGDTLRIDGTTYRLHGVDAPEKAQVCCRGGVDGLCGQEDATWLRRLVADRPVRCREKDRDRYGRFVAVCWAGGLELNREFVRAGLAWAYRRYGRDYEDAELEARRERRGVWAAEEAQPAWEWRAQKRRNGAAIRG